MYNFVYNIPTKIYFGGNQISNLGKELKKFGNKVLLCYGGGSIKKIGLYDEVVEEIKKAGLELFELNGIEPNPRVTSVKAGAEICKKEKIDVLLAVGGGSVIDCTKAIGAATFYEGDPWDLIIGKVKIEKALPLVSILTLSATGSEMDIFAVISNMDSNDKVGFASKEVLPKVSFLDPKNTFTVSPYQTACGSVDILSHIIETYFNREGSMYMLDTFMEGMMKTVIKYAPIAMKNPENEEARANLMWTSSWAINGFISSCQTCTWTCHPIEHQLSAYYDITHGLGLGILTPRWMKYVLDETNVDRFYNFGVNVFGIDKNLEPMEVANKSIEMLEKFLFEELGLKKHLSDLGIDKTHFEIMAKKACNDGILNGFKPLNQKDIENIYEMCL
ncbi:MULTISPECIES: iron-containing alcohol dehydrogenase [Fusobacterium]|uniref:iron-containing alcohol dehydrogenase n=1 Tax=Fusobacterium TaxID=848 RepID=UPI00147720A9|nr:MULTISPECIES: iron-containing alcohol dehydrogenase [Fusobacterium]NME35027.1 iron-containing alcohol dehydrogenase [Fusobacterium sp. FSA-380-WT-3A]